MRLKRYQPKHLNTEKKRRGFPTSALIVYLLIAVTLTTGISFSRYTATASGSDSARVAKWDIQLNVSTDTKKFEGNMDTDNKEQLSYSFSVSSASEVSAEYSLTVGFSAALDASITPAIDGIVGTPDDSRTSFTFTSDDWTFSPGTASKEHTLILTRQYFQENKMPENFSDITVSISVIAEQID